MKVAHEARECGGAQLNDGGRLDPFSGNSPHQKLIAERHVLEQRRTIR